MDIEDFKTDFFNFMTVGDMLNKYDISNTLYYKIVKQSNLHRKSSSKILRIMGDNTKTTKEIMYEPKTDIIEIVKMPIKELKKNNQYTTKYNKDANKKIMDAVKSAGDTIEKVKSKQSSRSMRDMLNEAKKAINDANNV